MSKAYDLPPPPPPMDDQFDLPPPPPPLTIDSQPDGESSDEESIPPEMHAAPPYPAPSFAASLEEMKSLEDELAQLEREEALIREQEKKLSSIASSKSPDVNDSFSSNGHDNNTGNPHKEKEENVGLGALKEKGMEWNKKREKKEFGRC